MRIVFLDRATIGPSVEVIRPKFDHDWVEYDRTNPEQVAERIAEADIVITNKAPIGPKELEAAPRLKMISVAATGYDVINVDACKARNVIVSNVRGYAINTVPEHAFSLILSLRRSVSAYHQDVMKGEWQKAAQFCFFNHPIDDLRNSRLGVIGEGVIGQSVANIAKNGFGMEVVFLDHDYVSDEARAKDTFVSMDELLETSDVISLHCPLMPATAGMFGLEQFKKMKSSAILVNTSRGGLVQEEALVTALQEGMIGGAGIDVLAVEPPADDHPYFGLMDQPNFILTPHVAWASKEAMQTLWNQVIEHVENFEKGSPSNVL
ncbi:D-2-hydroxyacid dehydrogenase [Terasakiella sp. SH-1]|uniref:D-2-hydroxyacid dehydrogenase n=1 Tax=Terasakiella sp. SH-1 TaxID=2560057 RepID=UPI00107325B4|nr:D-2-hydroxyacid dehydrogenase [Terasakiella sp. SH-1]